MNRIIYRLLLSLTIAFTLSNAAKAITQDEFETLYLDAGLTEYIYVEGYKSSLKINFEIYDKYNIYSYLPIGGLSNNKLNDEGMIDGEYRYLGYNLKGDKIYNSSFKNDYKPSSTFPDKRPFDASNKAYQSWQKPDVLGAQELMLDKKMRYGAEPWNRKMMKDLNGDYIQPTWIGWLAYSEEDKPTKDYRKVLRVDSALTTTQNSIFHTTSWNEKRYATFYQQYDPYMPIKAEINVVDDDGNPLSEIVPTFGAENITFKVRVRTEMPSDVHSQFTIRKISSKFENYAGIEVTDDLAESYKTYEKTSEVTYTLTAKVADLGSSFWIKGLGTIEKIDDKELTTTCDANIQVRAIGPTPLVAIKKGSVYSEKDGHTFTLNENNNLAIPFKNLSRLNGGTIYSYEWRVNGQSKMTSAGYGETTNFMFNTIGVYTLELAMLLTDGNRLVDTITFNITKDDPSQVLVGKGQIGLRADERDQEQFDVEKGIPSSEELYVNVIGDEYTIKEEVYKKVTGTIPYSVTVEKTYDWDWTESYTVSYRVKNKKNHLCHDSDDDGVKDTCKGHWETEYDTEYRDRSNSRKVSKTYTIERDYTYYKVQRLEVYRLAEALVLNEVLNNGQIKLTPSGYTPPHIQYIPGNRKNDHILEPSPRNVTITLSSEYIADGSSNPSVPSPNWRPRAEAEIGLVKVKNDGLTFNGEKVLERGNWVETVAPEPGEIPYPNKIDRDVLYQKDLKIKDNQPNGTYGTSGKIVYEKMFNINGTHSNLEEVSITEEESNDVIVHTPVVCYPGKASLRNDYIYDQRAVIENNTATSIMLGRSSVIKFSTEGAHKDILGYGTGDYNKYTLKKQVKFPFDIYIGENRGGEYVKAESWYTLDKNKIYTEYYTPIWVDEGDYTVKFRTIAINGTQDQIDNNKEEEHLNRNNQNYMAYREMPVTVVGRLYNFKITDIIDYPLWEKVFRVDTGSYEHTGYTFDTPTLPILQGSHPMQSDKGTLKTGYGFRFQVDTVGNYATDGEAIKIKPTFRFVSKDGSVDEDVDLYYHHRGGNKNEYFVKVGGDRDRQNKRSYQLSNPYNNVDENKISLTYQNIKKTRPSLTISKYKTSKVDIGYTGLITLNRWLRVFNGSIDNLPGIQGSSELMQLKKKALESGQRWYGRYYLPNDLYICKKGENIQNHAKMNNGLDGKEDFWLKEGYVIVNFDMTTVKNKDINTDVLTYGTSENGCNMWELEGYPYNKTDSKGVTFNLNKGDIIFYYSSEKATDDYRVGGSH